MKKPLLFDPGQVVELRCFNKQGGPVLAGFFSDFSLLAKNAQEQSGKWVYVSVTLNEINPALLARAANRLQSNLSPVTGDKDVLRRRWLPVDFDPVRPTGISSTNEEHEQAIADARACREWLTGKGWPEPILADSGNGAHLLYRIDLPVTDIEKKLLENTLKAIGLFRGTPTMTIDAAVVNAGRVWKCYGTMSCKGDNLPDRPHRVSKVLEHPDTPMPVPVTLLQQLAQTIPTPSSLSKNTHRETERVDVPLWLEKTGLEVLREGHWNANDYKWVLRQCPFDSAHGTDSAVFQLSGGAVIFKCLHNGCAENHWQQLRELLDPIRTNGHHLPTYPTPASLPQQPEPPTLQLPAPIVGHHALVVADLVMQSYNDAEALAKSGRMFFGLDCGFGAINEKLNGLCPGELTVLAGRPSQGKTTMALQMAQHIAQEEKVPVGIISLEMTVTQVGAKFCGMMSQVDPYRQRRGRLEPEEQEAYAEAIKRFARLPLWIFSEAKTVEQVDSLFVQHPEIKLWIVDHLHRMKGPGDSKHEELGTITEGLDGLTKKHEKHLLLLAQLNRECESRPDKMPQIGDLRGSGSIEEHAVNVLMIHRPGQYRELRRAVADDPFKLDEMLREATVLVEKGRFEGVGSLELAWIPEKALFANASPRNEHPPIRQREPFTSWQGDR